MAKVKAHLDEDALLIGTIDIFHLSGNKIADALAGRGAETGQQHLVKRGW